MLGFFWESKLLFLTESEMVPLVRLVRKEEKDEDEKEKVKEREKEKERLSALAVV